MICSARTRQRCEIFNARFCHETARMPANSRPEVTDTIRVRHRERFAYSLTASRQITTARSGRPHFSHLEFYPNFRNSSLVTFFNLRKKPEKYQASPGRTGGICFARFQESQKRNFFL
jgi:hypothetical protein